jgi:hypothetical protein
MIVAILPEKNEMNVLLLVNGREVARFEYGTHAMWAALTLSKEDDRLWTVIDERDSEVTTIEYRNGKGY